MRVLFVAGDSKPERWTQPIQALLPEAEIVTWDPNGAPVYADYAIAWRPPAELFAREPQLKAIFNLGAGVDGLLSLPELPADLTVVRLEDAGMSVQMAEHVVHQLLEISRNMQVYRAQQDQHQWQLHRPIKRSEWPIGVMGMGQIGSRVASTLASLDYPVNGWARSEHSLADVTTFAGPDGLSPFLQASRVLVNTLPLTDTTRDLINYDFLRQLQPDSVVINVGRGEHLVEQDLITALNEGLVARASLDVFRQEPLPAEHPFWQHPHIIVTPHISARSLRESTLEQITSKIRAHARGETITGVVDRSRGY